jgi:hypothetical protein
MSAIVKKLSKDLGQYLRKVKAQRLLLNLTGNPVCGRMRFKSEKKYVSMF